MDVSFNERSPEALTYFFGVFLRRAIKRPVNAPIMAATPIRISGMYSTGCYLRNCRSSAVLGSTKVKWAATRETPGHGIRQFYAW